MRRVSGTKDYEGHLQAIGLAIRTSRETISISQEELAHLAQIDRSHMGKIERGERNVTILNLIKISQALECQLSDLLAAAGL
jgi:transcriptional regulator with XRE-family HTH domain